jgi:hypothetical protein
LTYFIVRIFYDEMATIKAWEKSALKLKWTTVIILCLVLIAVFYMSKEPSDDIQNIPEGIFGEWETTNSKYEDRYFNITPDKVVFGIGEDNEAVYTLVGIQRKTEAGQTLFTATFEGNNGNSYEQSFYYENNASPILRFKNQKEIEWRKSDPMDE